MSKKTIEKNLRKALLENGPLVQALFEYELEEHIEEYRLSKHNDHDEYFFAITQHNNDVAMLLIDKQDNLHINEDARALLETLWHDAYKGNIERLIPDMAGELHAGYLYSAGVKTTDKPMFWKALNVLQEKFGKKMIDWGK